MPRYAIKIEYNGAPFVGWQRQRDELGVQQVIEDALRKLEPDQGGIQGAGRTDAGVHARGQVAHFDMAKEWEPFRLSEALNFHLREYPVAIVDCAVVGAEFHARFSALERQYLFRIVSRRAPVVFDDGLVWQVRRALDADAMQRGADYLLGQHDYTTFRSTMCQAQSPIKSVDQLDVETCDYEGGTEYRFHVRARSFLHNQVRSFVGTLERVGAGAWAPEDVRAALAAQNRTACGPVSPPQGLYLTHVRYPEEIF